MNVRRVLAVFDCFHERFGLRARAREGIRPPSNSPLAYKIMRHARSRDYDIRPRQCGCSCGEVVLGRTERKHKAKKKHLLARAREHELLIADRGRPSSGEVGQKFTALCSGSYNGEVDAGHILEESSFSSPQSSGNTLGAATTQLTPKPLLSEIPVTSGPGSNSNECNQQQLTGHGLSEEYFSDEDDLLEEEYSDRFCIKLLHWKQKFSVSRAAFDELRNLLRTELQIALPSLYVMTSLLDRHCPVELETKMVDACPAGCVLFAGKYADKSRCPNCGKLRWEDSPLQNAPLRKPTGQFIHYSPTSQLKSILQNPKMVQVMEEYVASFREENCNLKPGEEPEVLRDYFDGQDFLMSCREQRANFGKPKTLYFALATDGVEYAKKPVKSLWPFTLELINLPPGLRRKMENTVIVGVLFGYPSEMSSVLEYLVDELMAWNYEDWKLQFCFLIADTPALNKLLGFSGHTSMVKCPQHKYRGFYSPKYGTYYMPNDVPLSVTDNLAALEHPSNTSAARIPLLAPFDRCDAEVRRGVEQLAGETLTKKRTALKQQYGLCDTPTPLSRLPGFQYHTAATFETLHITLLGVGKLYLKLLCRDASLRKYPSGSNNFELSEEALDGIAIDCATFSRCIHPQLMPRIMRSPKDGLGGLRAEDFSNSLFLLPVLLLGRLPSAHVQGASFMVEAISLLSQTALDRHERARLELATREFLDYFYGHFYRRSESRINVCSYVVHRFGDGPALLRLHGPGWTTWSFFVETIGGLIANSVKSMSNPEASLASSIRLVRKLVVTLPQIENQIAERQRRRKQYHSSRTNYRRRQGQAITPSFTSREETNDTEDDDQSDEEEVADSAELLVPLSDLVQFDEDGFYALFSFLHPQIKEAECRRRLQKEMAMDPIGKYVATYRKLKTNGFTFVSFEALRPSQRHRCYAVVDLGNDRPDVIVQILSFFHHVYKGKDRSLFAYLEADNPSKHDHVGELSFRRWTTRISVAGVEVIVKPAAIVYRGPSSADKSGIYFYLRRVELLSRISFQP